MSPDVLSPLYTYKDEKLEYDGSYMLCGTLLDGKSELIQDEPKKFHWELEWVEVYKDVNVAFTRENKFCCDKGKHPAPAFTLRLDVELPWMLEEENTYRIS